MAKVPFGRDGCSDIAVDEFDPICSYGGIGGTDPITLSVPVPSLVPPVPPEECACLSFDAEKPEVSVVAGKTGKAWVDIESNGDCCGGAYTVTPHVEIPKCTTDDFSDKWEGLLSPDDDSEAGVSASVKLELRVTDCTPSVTVSGQIHVPRYPVLCPPAIDVKPVPVNVKYTNEEGYEQTKVVNNFLTIKKDKRTYCGSVIYELEFGTLDLTGIGGGASIGGGGSVFMSADDNNLYTDGSTISSDKTWYGGGFGDRADDYPTHPYRRGWRIRGLSGSDLDADDPTPYVEIPQPCILLEDASDYVQAWYSTRKTTSGNDIVVEYGTGNLVMTTPSGFQWHEQGLALTLTTFTHNEAGLLSSAQEEPYAIVVSPAPMLKVTGSAAAPTVHNISGLAVTHGMTTTDASFTDGLSVNDGYGLRIHGLDERTVPSGDESLEDWLTGSLELHYGKGFRIKTIGSNGSSGYIYRQSSADGALEIDAGRGLHFTSCKSGDGKPVAERDGRIEILADARDFTFIGSNSSDIENAELVINDAAAAAVVEFTDPGKNDDSQIWDRTKNRELMLKIRVFDANFDNPKFLVLRYLANGVLMGCRWLYNENATVTWKRKVTDKNNVSNGCSQKD